MMKIQVERGDVLWVEYAEQQVSKLQLVVQNDKGNRFSPTTIVIPLVEEKRSHIQVEDNISLAKGKYVVYEPRTIAEQRIKGKVGKVSPQTMNKVDALARMIFQFKEGTGDVYWVQMPGSVGSEQKGKRPCVVLRNSRIVIPLTGSKNMRTKLPTQFEVTADDFMNKYEAMKKGMESLSRAMTEQMQFIDDVTRIGDKIGTLKKGKEQEINRSINVSIGIDAL